MLTLSPPSVGWVKTTARDVTEVEEGTVEWTIRGRKGKPVRVRCVQTPDARPLLPEWPSNASCTGAGGCQSIPYLKSHLQKCVRKGLAPQAVATTKQLLKLNVVECVRRLAVIMVEDVVLHPQAMGVLLWWTVVLAHRTRGAGQGPTLRCTDVPLWLCEWVLGLVHVLCAHPVCVQLPNVLPTTTPWQRLQALDAVPATLRHTLCSLYLRATYGGLKSDVALLEQAAERLCCGDAGSLLTAPILPIVWESVDMLPSHAWDLDAIDFHVVPRLFELVERGDEERERPPIDTSFEEESTGEAFDWKRMMWENGSMTNVRRPNGEIEDELYGCEVWAEWLPRVRPLQRWLVRKSYGS